MAEVFKMKTTKVICFGMIVALRQLLDDSARIRGALEFIFFLFCKYLSVLVLIQQK